MSDLDVEQRLRVHFADRAAREPLGEPDPEPVMAAARARPAGARRLRPVSGRPRRSFRLAVVGGLAAACLLAVVAVVVTGDDDSDRTDIGRPEPTVPTTGRPDRTTVPEPTTATTTPGATVVAPAATDRTLIVARQGVLGGWDGTRWLPLGSTNPAPAQGGERYQVVRVGEPVTAATGGSPRIAGCIENDHYEIDVGFGETGPTDDTPVAVSGAADVHPRPVTVLSPAAPEYRTAAGQVLASLGIQDDPLLRQVVRADLDGDGADEVLVRAERLADREFLRPVEGEYSVLFLRRLVGGAVRDTVLFSDTAHVEAESRYMMAFDLGAVADLNGDGRMEVVVGYRYYEGAGTAVYEVAPDGGLVQVLYRGCGV